MDGAKRYPSRLAQGLMGFAALYPSYELPSLRTALHPSYALVVQHDLLKIARASNPVVGIMSCAAW